MIIAKLDDKNIEELTLNLKNSIGEEIQYDTTYFENLDKLRTITLNGFIIDDNTIEKLNYLKNLKTIIFNHCKFNNKIKLESGIENVIITYSNIEYLNIFKNIDKIKSIELIETGEVNMNNFIEMKNLIKLEIYNSKIKNSKRINDFSNLKILKLDGSLVDEQNFSDLLNENITFSYKEKFYLEE